MAKLSREGLKRLALTHAIELIFIRRDKYRMPKTRRMFMTLDPLLLNSALGKKLLHFKKPIYPRAYDPTSKNLLFVWDIIMQDWRAIPIESANIIEPPIPTRPQKLFWEYYNNVLVKMTSTQKSSFMDK